MIKMRVEVYLILEYDTANSRLSSALLKEAGGFTISPTGDGVWLNANDEAVFDRVVVLTTFMDDTPDNRLLLESVCLQYKQEAKQDCVMYVVNTNEVNYL